jgi:putative transposase
MARPLRIHYENACYHVTCRGNGRQAIFLSDGDRKRFLDLLARSLEIYQVDLLAFVLMDNHFHLIVRTPKANLKEFMRHFNISYTASFNKGHGRSGHLYQGRYKAFLIDADSYLLAVSRYVHCNPVHTNECTGTDDGQKKRYLRKYPWSSYPDYIGAYHHAFLSTADVLAQFGNNKAAYRTFVEKGLTTTERPLEKGRGHGVIGDEAFIKRIVEPTALRPERERPAVRSIISQVEPQRILDTVAHRFSITTEELKKAGYRTPARSIAMELLYRHGGMNQRQIGEVMGVDYSTVSVARKRLRAALAGDDGLMKDMASVEAALRQG